MQQQEIPVWELLQKRMVWAQIGEISGRRILDFGSGNGMTADHFARDNEVVAVEPDETMPQACFMKNEYTLLYGDIHALQSFAPGTFDLILCHNVLEYAQEREAIVREFARLLKKGGLLSILKHNRAGRVMQMAVLLDDFERAAALLDGQDGQARQFGAIRYYEDDAICGWSDQLVADKVLGMRTFWDLQQNQQRQGDPRWQEQMLALEMRVSERAEFRAVAFFHHLLLHRK